MRIGIDARFYGPVGKGIGRYIQKLIEYLEKIDFKNQYFIFLRQENFDLYQPKNKNFQKILIDYPWYSWKEQFFLSFKLRKYKLDLVHFPHFNVPILYRGKFVVTIHDLIITRFPGQRATTLPPILYRLKWLFYNIVIRSAVRRAKKIIAVSQFTKSEIVKYLKIKPEKVAVIYEAAEFTSHQSLVIDNQIKIRFGLKKPYILYVGNAYPHKNLENLVSAFEILLKDYHQDLQLVLVGAKDFFYQRLINRLQKLKLESDRIILTGSISDQDLDQLYRQALIYVFPSFCEGFGLPGLEAMSRGVPVVASRAASLPEIYQQAAFYFNPRQIKEIAKAIFQVINDENLRNKLCQQGCQRVEKFSWRKTAEETMVVYLEALK